MVTRIVLMICVLGAFGYAGNAWLGLGQTNADRTTSEATVVRLMGIIDPAPKHLAVRSTEYQGTLLAAPAADPSRLIAQETIVLAHLADAKIKLKKATAATTGP